ncbi:MAG: amino acid adenylation domain-containing protein, partial [Candidatus Aminicenantes bacterium]
GDHYGFYFEASRALRLRQSCAGSDNTVFMHLLAAFNVLLHKYTGQDDIIVGSGILGRRHADMDHIIGLFVNTLALRNYPAPDKTFLEFLKEVKHTCINAFENQDLQLEELVRLLQLNRDASRHPLFDVCLVNQNFEQSKKEIKGIKVEPYKEFENKTSKFDLTLFVHEGDNEIYFELEYYTGIFKRETITKLANHFLTLLERVIEEPGACISDIDIMSAEERNRLLYDFNDTAVESPGDKTLYELFAEQAEKTPDNAAIIGEMQSAERKAQSIERNKERHAPCAMRCALTYRELKEQSEQLALLLQAKGIQPGTVMAIMVERSLEMVIGILGILKAGGAYLPIEPDYPQDRIDFMLKDSNVRVLVSKVSGVIELSPDSWKSPLERGGRGASPIWPKGRGVSKPAVNLAYIIYTSGTTGKPKGVMIEHKGAVNTLLYRKEEYQMNSNVIALQLFSYVFDGFVTSFFTPIISGARVVLLNRKSITDIEKIKEVIVKNKVTHFISVPALYRAIIESLTPGEAVSLEVVTLAGDRLSPDIIEITKAKNRNIEIANEYGVTEAAVMSTIYRNQEKDHCIKIGHPVWNTTLYIVDKGLKLQPSGVPGELCIAGVGVSRGYLNNPELTAEKFLSVFNRSYRSYMSYISKKIYKTGDLARWLPDG